jgi:hypothetical protein
MASRIPESKTKNQYSNYVRTETSAWVPQVKVLDKEGRLIVRADVPGLKKEDLKVSPKTRSLFRASASMSKRIKAVTSTAVNAGTAVSTPRVAPARTIWNWRTNGTVASGPPCGGPATASRLPASRTCESCASLGAEIERECTRTRRRGPPPACRAHRRATSLAAAPSTGARRFQYFPCVCRGRDDHRYRLGFMGRRRLCRGCRQVHGIASSPQRPRPRALLLCQPSCTVIRTDLPGTGSDGAAKTRILRSFGVFANCDSTDGQACTTTGSLCTDYARGRHAGTDKGTHLSLSYYQTSKKLLLSRPPSAN